MNASPLLYLAYGSNLHPLRLRERVPSARLAGVVELTGYRLRFNKRSIDGSGKCNLEASGNGAHRVYAAVYEVAGEEKPDLDRAESGYDEIKLEIDLNGKTVEGFTYIAKPGNVEDTLRPYDWYKAMVLLGVRYHRFPEEYLRQVEAVVPVMDRDKERRAGQKQLLALMMQANAGRF